jgi:aminobenzoyl-glutamate utilization protein B
LADALEAEGFQLTRNAGGIPNAFIASFGAGQPVIALLGEFDALAGLSQQAHCAEPASPTPGENGHGCGHNLLGGVRRRGRRQELAAAARRQRHAALLRLSRRGRRLRENLYGARGLFDDVDAALTWHPEAWAGMFSTSTLANIQAAWRLPAPRRTRISPHWAAARWMP